MKKNYSIKRILLVKVFLVFSVLNLQAQVGLEYVKQLGGSNFGLGSLAVNISQNHNITLSGVFHDTVDFDPGPGVFNLISNSGSDDIFILKLDSAGNFLWAKKVGSATFTEQPNFITTDINENVYVSGYFSGAADYDPGPGVFNMGSNGGYDAFVLKLDENGNFVWAKHVGGSSDETSGGVQVDNSGNIFLAGSFSGCADFDPGLTDSIFCGGSSSAFILKLNSAGDLTWVKRFGGLLNVTDLERINNGHLFITGYYYGANNFAPTGASFVMTASGGADTYVSKLNANGDLIWAKSLGGAGNENPTNIEVDNNGSVYTTGYFDYFGSDFDPGPSVAPIQHYGFIDAFISKLDSSGNYAWAKSFGGGGDEYGHDISIDQNYNVYATGRYEGTADFDPNIGIFNMTSNGSYDIYMTKLNPTGNLIWAREIGGALYDSPVYIEVNDSGNIYLAGGFHDTVDFNPDTTIYNLYAGAINNNFICKLFQDSCANIGLNVDSVSNVTCLHQGYASAYGFGALSPYTYQWNTIPVTNDSISFFTTDSIYTVQLTASNGCIVERSVMINAPQTTLMGSFDLNTNLFSSEFRSGFQTGFWMDAYNDGCLPVTGELKLIIDPDLTFISSTPPADAIVGDTLIWNFTNLIFDSLHITPYIVVSTPAGTPFGTPIDLETRIFPISGDFDSTNNIKIYNFTVVNGYDPNKKSVYPQGTCIPKYIQNDEQITYTIQFQNTGNSNAINIHILDTIDENYDINSMRVIASSHNLITEVLDSNIIKFRYDNINLPDSSSNEINSHGYVIYEINAVSSIPDYTPVNNSASIYFDYNAPIITNNLQNMLVEILPGNHNVIVNQVNDTLTAVLPGFTYQWIDCDDHSVIAGATNQSYAPLINGNYAVVVFDNYCTDTSACMFVDIMSVESYLNELIVYPNPVNGQYFNIKSTIPIIGIQLYNSIGQIIQSEVISTQGNNIIIERPEVPNGIYTIEIMFENSIVRKKIVF